MSKIRSWRGKKSQSAEVRGVLCWLSLTAALDSWGRVEVQNRCWGVKGWEKGIPVDTDASVLAYLMTTSLRHLNSDTTKKFSYSRKNNLISYFRTKNGVTIITEFKWMVTFSLLASVESPERFLLFDQAMRQFQTFASVLWTIQSNECWNDIWFSFTFIHLPAFSQSDLQMRNATT